MFDEYGNFIGGTNTLSQLRGIEGLRYGQPLTQPQQGFGLNQAMNLGDPNQFDAALTNMGQQPQSLVQQLGGFGGMAQLGLGAIGTIGGLVNSRNMLGLARDQFKQARDVTNTNLTNQIQSYNTALADRARTRAAMEGRDMESANKYVEENKLRR